MKGGRLKYFIAAFSAVVIWGFMSIPLRKIQSYPADEILHYRVFTSLIISWLFIFLFRRNELRADIAEIKVLDRRKRRRLILLTCIAGILITGNWFTYIYTVNHVNLKSAAFAYLICPLITAVGGFLILKEHLTTLKITALGIALVSILILAQGSLIDAMWSVIVATLYSFYLIIQRVMTSIDKMNMLGVHLIIAALLILPVFLYSYNSMPADLNFWFYIIIISVFFTIIPLFLSLYALIGMPSSTLGVMIYFNPIVAFAVAFFYFDEGITIAQVYAYSLLFGAVFIFNWKLIMELFFKSRSGKTTNVSPEKVG